MLFNEEGFLSIDEMVAENASFRNIMADGVVSDEELAAQSGKVVAMLQNVETKCSEEQLSDIKALLAEMGVLYAIYNFHSLQQLDK